MLDLLRCPSCGRDEIRRDEAGDISCAACGSEVPSTQVAPGERVPDFRLHERSETVSIEFRLPHRTLPPDKIQQFGRATEARFECPSREEIRKVYGTKLQKEVLYYVQQVYDRLGPEAIVLDLGSGSGGTRRYLESVGFTRIVSVDYWSSDAEYLVETVDYLADVHRLPFRDGAFDLIITTATLEHFYNPHVAFHEMRRVLKPEGSLIASGSFWERWHADSCFHFTPNGLWLLCRSAGLQLHDLWSGWGFIPAIFSHALGTRKFRDFMYGVQSLFDAVFRRIRGPEWVKMHRLKTSGSFGIYATRPQAVAKAPPRRPGARVRRSRAHRESSTERKSSTYRGITVDGE